MLMWLELGELGGVGVGREGVWMERWAGPAPHWTWCQRKQLGFAPSLSGKQGRELTLVAGECQADDPRSPRGEGSEGVPTEASQPWRRVRDEKLLSSVGPWTSCRGPVILILGSALGSAAEKAALCPDGRRR